jgi:hypothetical protein
MADTFIKIASVTVGAGGASSIDFTSIPSTYTDLVLKISARSNKALAGADWAKIAFNGVATNQTLRALYGSGSTAGSYTDTAIYVSTTSNSQTASTFGNSEYYIPNYAGSTNKSVSGDGTSETNASTNNDLILIAGLWSSTAAINQITLTPFTGTAWLQYSTATLYGIKNS